MELKEFFKPNWKKIVLFFLLFIVFSVLFGKLGIWSGVSSMTWITRPRFGFPFVFITEEKHFLTEEIKYCFHSFYNLIIDCIIWYLASSAIIAIFTKVNIQKT